MMRRWPRAVRLMGVGWYIAAAIIIGLALGLWLDAQTGLSPLFVLLGLALGLAAAFRGVFQLLSQLEEDEGEEDD